MEKYNDEASLMRKRVTIRRILRRAIKEEDDELLKVCEGPINQYQSAEIMINPPFIKSVFLGFSIATQGTYKHEVTLTNWLVIVRLLIY